MLMLTLPIASLDCQRDVEKRSELLMDNFKKLQYSAEDRILKEKLLDDALGIPLGTTIASTSSRGAYDRPGLVVRVSQSPEPEPKDLVAPGPEVTVKRTREEDSDEDNDSGDGKRANSKEGRPGEGVGSKQVSLIAGETTAGKCRQKKRVMFEDEPSPPSRIPPTMPASSLPNPPPSASTTKTTLPVPLMRLHTALFGRQGQAPFRGRK